jgi:hypothetical protein
VCVEYVYTPLLLAHAYKPATLFTDTALITVSVIGCLLQVAKAGSAVRPPLAGAAAAVLTT